MSSQSERDWKIEIIETAVKKHRRMNKHCENQNKHSINKTEERLKL